MPLLENPNFREMVSICIRCFEKATLRFSKPILDSFFSFPHIRSEYRESDAKRRTSTHANRICAGVDPGAKPGNAAGRAGPIVKSDRKRILESRSWTKYYRRRDSAPLVVEVIMTRVPSGYSSQYSRPSSEALKLLPLAAGPVQVIQLSSQKLFSAPSIQGSQITGCGVQMAGWRLCGGRNFPSRCSCSHSTDGASGGWTPAGTEIHERILIDWTDLR
jgi:hypothetical protein